MCVCEREPGVCALLDSIFAHLWLMKIRLPTSAISMQLHSTLTCTIIYTSSYVVSDVQ